MASIIETPVPTVVRDTQPTDDPSKSFLLLPERLKHTLVPRQGGGEEQELLRLVEQQ